jgi:hypothetical protein
MSVIESATSIAYAKNFRRHPSDASSAGTSTVANQAQLKVFSDIIARIIIPRKIHIINDAFHFEFLVKSQKISGFRVASVEDWANFEVEPEFVYIDDPKAKSVQVEVRTVIEAAACSLGEDKILIERLTSREKSQLSVHGAGMYPADALSAEIRLNENTMHKAYSSAAKNPSKVDQDEIIREDNAPEDVKAELVKFVDSSSTDSGPIEEFFEKIKDKSKFAYLQNRLGDKTSCFGGCTLEDTLPEDLFLKLNEWNKLVSGSLSETPKILTSFGPTKSDPVMILAISKSQRLLVELNANKFGVAIALWNSITKTV